MADEIHCFDQGTALRCTILDCDTPVNVSGAVTLDIILKRPDGALLTKAASLVTDGTDGKIEYITASSDLSMAGLWKLQCVVGFESYQWKSSVSSFRVFENL